MGVVAQAVADATAVAATLGVRCEAPVVLADGANVVVHLRPAPVVAKVAATTHLVREPADWLARELRLAARLVEAGVPVVAPFDERVHLRGDAVMSLWHHLPHQPAAVVAARELGPRLRALHAALATCHVPLPRLATPLEDLARFLARTPHDGMQRAYDRVVPQLGDAEGQALHGDPHPGNLLLAGDGWTWCDLEDACSGPVAWDLACLLGSTRIDGEAAVRAYGSDPRELGPWRELRRLHATAWYALYAERLPRHRARAAELLASWG